MKTRELKIEGMHCEHWATSLRRELSKLPSVRIEDVKIGKVLIRYDECMVSYEPLNQAVEEAGYKII